MYKIILASSSPRRMEMIHNFCEEPVIIPSNIDETLPSDITKERAVMLLSLKKALASRDLAKAASEEYKDYYLIAADTIVYKDGLLGKPSSRADAKRMLQKISGTYHYVLTGVTVIDMNSPRIVTFYDSTKVHCMDLTNSDLEEYLDTDEPYDKAGAYAIQGEFGEFIKKIEGSYNNVVGLPTEKLEEVLKDLEETGK